MVTISAIVREQAGYCAALLGLSFNKKRSPAEMHEAALKLAPHDGGHNKFLESMYIWVEVRAPRYLWQEMDTYRLSTKQSESTMHTLVNELKTMADGDDCLDRSMASEFQESQFEEGCHIEVLERMFKHAMAGELRELKSHLPEGFMQKRMWCMSLKTFRNIILQRRNHRLPHWKLFIRSVVKQLNYPELLGIEDVKTI